MNVFKENIKFFVAVILAVLVLFSTSGFRIYTHDCHHSNTHNVSILIPANECGHNNNVDQKESCCAVVENEETCSQCNEPAAEDNCCSNSEQIVKLDTRTLLNFTTPIIKVAEIDLHFVKFQSGFESLEFKSFVFISIPKIEIPPPLIVLEFLSFIQVYII